MEIQPTHSPGTQSNGLNITVKSWKDLVTDEEFTRRDIITLQDPQNLESRNLSDFKYLKGRRRRWSPQAGSNHQHLRHGQRRRPQNHESKRCRRQSTSRTSQHQRHASPQPDPRNPQHQSSSTDLKAQTNTLQRHASHNRSCRRQLSPPQASHPTHPLP